MSTIISIAGQQGGCGKTTTAVNLSASLALAGKRTLLVDCDPCSAASATAALRNTGKSHDLGSMFLGRAQAKDVVHETLLKDLSVIPAGPNLYAASAKAAVRPDSETLLRHGVRTITDNYDFVVLDSPPSFSFLSVSALTASDWVIIPFRYDARFLFQVNQLLVMMNRIKKQFKVALKIAGFLYVMEGRHAMARDLKKEEMGSIRDLVYRTPIPRDERFREAAGLGRPIALLDLESSGAKAFLDVTAEVVSFFD